MFVVPLWFNLAMRTIDLNADVGEGSPNDGGIIPIITSANISCGGHAGNEESMHFAARLAITIGTIIGAHPGHEDREHFGRRELPITPDELVALLNRQVNRLHATVAGLGGEVRYLKLHGALYHQANWNAPLANAVIEFLEEFHTPLALLGQDSSPLAAAADLAGVPFFNEAFADRSYLADGTLAPRSSDKAVLNPKETGKQAVALALGNPIAAIDGTSIRVPCDSICVHGDDEDALERAQAAYMALSGKPVARFAFAR